MKKIYIIAILIMAVLFAATNNTYAQANKQEIEKRARAAAEKVAAERVKRTFPSDFFDFFEDFTKSREQQIDLINNQLTVNRIYMGDDDVVREKEYIKKSDLKEWKFIESDYFIENNNVEEHFYGRWNKKSNNEIEYQRGINESGFYEIFLFKRVNGKWCLFEYTYHSL